MTERRFVSGWLLLLLLLTPAVAGAVWEQESLEVNGDWQKRLDVVILGDGYTAEQQGNFRADALHLIDTVFGMTPFRDYRAHYNFHLVYVISNESGADIPSRGILVDTALDATFEAYGVARLLVVNDIKATAAAAQVASVDFIFVLVNHSDYGGSGGALAVTSLHPDAPEILAHEVGHMFAGLADEYEDPYPGYPAGDSEPNVTYATELSRIPWSVWIAPATPLPTPATFQYRNTVGLFEGARYLSRGIYRPRLNCRMRMLGVHFCEVCTEQLVRASYVFASPSDAEGGDFTLGAGEEILLDAEPVQSLRRTVFVTWTLNGEVITYGVDQVPVIAECLGDGEHTVMATVADRSTRLRLDDVRLLAGDEVRWNIRVESAGMADPQRCEWPPPVEYVPDTDGDEPDGDTPDGDPADGDAPDGDPADGDSDGDRDEDEGDTPDGNDRPDTERPDWWPDPDTDPDTDKPAASGSGGCHGLPNSASAPAGLLLLALLMGLRRWRGRSAP